LSRWPLISRGLCIARPVYLFICLWLHPLALKVVRFSALSACVPVCTCGSRKSADIGAARPVRPLLFAIHVKYYIIRNTDCMRPIDWNVEPSAQIALLASEQCKADYWSHLNCRWRARAVNHCANYEQTIYTHLKTWVFGLSSIENRLFCKIKIKCAVHVIGVKQSK